MDLRDFDWLARIIGSGQSRRGLLKTLASGALGVAGLGRVGAAAAKGSNAACAQFCADAYGAGTYAAFQCTTDGARRRGLCDQCGPGNPSSGMIACGGTCIPACTPSDPCHAAGTCDPSTGACSNPIKANNTPCSDGNACTQTDSCQGGACVGFNPVTCIASDQCHGAGTCDLATGMCSDPPKSAGAPCNDQNACTQNDTCDGQGTCAGNPVSCSVAADQCHVAGTCDPRTGKCPTQSNGAACSDGNPLCINGACCTSGHEVINGGCFRIGNNFDCAYGCDALGSVEGTGNYLCARGTDHFCPCPTGEACALGHCIAPCGECCVSRGPPGLPGGPRLSCCRRQTFVRVSLRPAWERAVSAPSGT